MYVTSEQGDVSIGESIPMQNCNHEESDTRIAVHALHALEQGKQTIYVRTVDTDVAVILAGTFHDLVVAQPLCDTEWTLAWARITNFNCSSPMPSVKVWESHNHERYLYSTHVHVVVQLLPSRARARSRFGSPGRHIKTRIQFVQPPQ